MKIFLAIGSLDNFRVNLFKECKVERILISYASIRKENNLTVPFPEVMLDSGAYSVETGVQRVSLDSYILWLQLYLNQYPQIKTYVNLDDLSDPYVSMKNQSKMESEGLSPMPVYHYKEPEEILNYMCDTYEYVGLGGMAIGTMPWQQLQKFWEYVYHRYPDNKFHIFGVGTVQPFFYCQPYCLANSSANQVLLWDNIATEASKVKIGDKLVGFDGEKFVPTTVTNIFRKQVQELLKITYIRERIPGGRWKKKECLTSTSITVSLEHPFYVLRNGKWSWVEARNLQVEDELFFFSPREHKKLLAFKFSREHSQEEREKISKSLKKRKDLVHWNKGLTKETDPRLARVSRVVSSKLKGRKTGNRIKDKVKLRERAIKGFKTRQKRPTSIEVMVMNITEEYNLPLEYVGNGKFWVGDKVDEVRNPDFKVNGRKKVVEVYDSSMPGRDAKLWQIERSKHYPKYGYSCLFIDVHENTKNNIIKELTSFCHNGAKIIKVEKLILGKYLGRGAKKYFNTYNFHCEPCNNFVVNWVLTHNSIDSTSWNVGARFGDLMGYKNKLPYRFGMREMYGFEMFFTTRELFANNIRAQVDWEKLEWLKSVPERQGEQGRLDELGF